MEVLDLSGSVDISTGDSSQELLALDALTKTLRSGFDTMAANITGSLGGIEKAISSLADTSAQRLKDTLHPKPPQLDPIADAYKHLGVSMQKELDSAAKAAQSAYDTIEKAGTATPRELEQAWASAQKAIARAAIPPKIDPPKLDPVEDAFRHLGVTMQKELDASARKAQDAYDTISKSGTASARDLERAWVAAQKDIARAAAVESAKVHKNWQEIGDKLGRVGSGLTNVGRDLAIGVTAPIAAASVAVVKFGSDFESAFAGVKKTVADRSTPEQLAAIRSGLRGMAQEIPVAADALADVAAAAGQLGVKTENILKFTRVMADLGVATNLSATEAATALARFANITKLSQDQFSNLGSTVVALGNNFATTEKEIVEMGLRLAGAGTQIKLTDAQILGIAAALSSLGIEAEAGGTAFSRVMIRMQDAVKSGGKDLALFAKVAGESTGNFKRAFEKDAAGAISLFIAGLARLNTEGANLTPVLKELELGEIRVSDALRRTGNAYELVSNATGMATKAFAENTALTNEAAQRYQTLESQFVIFKNRLTEVALVLFDALRPALQSAMDLLAGLAQSLQGAATWFASLSPQAQQLVLTIAGIAASIGPVLIVVGSLASAISSIIGLFGLFGAGAATAAAGATAAGAATAAAGASTGLLGTALAAITGPIGLVIAAVVALAAAYATNFGGIRDVVNAVISEVVTMLGELWDAFMMIVRELGPLWDAFGQVVSATMAIIGGALILAIRLITAQLRFLQGDWKGAWDAIVGDTQKGTGLVVQQIQQTKAPAGAAANEVGKEIKTQMERGLTGTGQAVAKTAAEITKILQEMRVIIAAGGEDFRRFVENRVADVYEFERALREKAGQAQVNMQKMNEDVQRFITAIAEMRLTGVAEPVVQAYINEFSETYRRETTLVAVQMGEELAKHIREKTFVSLNKASAETGTGAAKVTGESYSEQIKKMNPGKDFAEALAADEPAVRAAAKRLADAAADEIGKGGKKSKEQWNKETAKSPFFIIADLMSALTFAVAFGDKLAPEIGKAGKKAKKEFELGFEGFDKFVDKIANQLINNPNSLDKVLGPSFKKLKQGATEAFDDILKSVNAYLAAQGKANQVSGEQLFNLAKTHKEAAKNIIETATAFKDLNTAIDTLNFQRVAAGLAPVDNSFKIVGRTIEISITAFEQLKKSNSTVISSLEKMGFTFVTEMPKMANSTQRLSEQLRDYSQRNKEYFESIEKAHEKLRHSWEQQWDAMIQALPTEQLKKKLGEIQSEAGNTASLLRVEIELATRDSINSVISLFTQYGEQLGLTGDKLKAFVERNVRKSMAEFEHITKQDIDKAIEHWKKASITLPGIWNEIFKNVNSNTKAGLSDLFEIIDLIPGRVGDSLRKAQAEFEKWYTLLDKTIRLIERALGENETEGLSGVISKVASSIGGIFKKANEGLSSETKSTAEAWSEDIAGVLGSMGGEAGEAGGESGKAFEGEFMAKVQAIAGGLATFFGTRGQGRAMGVLGGAMAGAQIGAAFGGGVGAAIGAGVGAIAGLFGTGGPSEAEKREAEEQKQREIERLKQELQKGYQEVLQAAIKTMQDAALLLEKLDDFTPVHKAIIQRFFKNLLLVLKLFVELAGNFKDENLQHAKVLAEALAPMLEAASVALDVLEKLLTFVAPAQARIEAFGAALSVLIAVFIAVTEEFTFKAVKQGKRFAEKMREIVGLILDAANAFDAVSEGAIPTRQAFVNLANGIQIALDEITRITEMLDKAGLKRAALMSERARAVLEALKAAVDVFEAAQGFSHIPREQLRLLADAIRVAIEEYDRAMAGLNDEAQAVGSKRAGAASPIVQLLAATIEPFIKAAEISEVPEQGIKALVAGLKLAVTLFITAMSEIALDLLESAGQRAGAIKAITEAIGGAAGMFGSIAQLQGADYYNLMAGVIDMLRFAIDRFIAQTTGLDNAALAAAAKTATTSKAIFDVLKLNADLMKSIAENGNSNIQPVIDRITAFRLIVDTFIKVAGDIGPEALARALAFGAQMKTVLELLMYALQTFSALGEFTGLPAEALGRMLAALDEAIAVLGLMLEKAQEAQGIAEEIRDAMRATAAALTDAGLSGNFIVTVGAENLNVRTVDTGPQVSTARTATINSAPNQVQGQGRGDTTEVHNHYYYGDTHIETRVEEVESLRDVELLIQRERKIEAEQRGRRFNTRQ